MRAPIPQREALLMLLAGARGTTRTGCFEVRPRRASDRQWSQDARRFFALEDTNTIVEYVAGLSRDHDVYVSAAPRVRAGGKREDVERVHMLWADCDTPEARERLRLFEPLPRIVVNSGSAENCHAYWPLRDAISPEDAKRANRRIALKIGADDQHASDIARVIRAPGTLNHKHRPPAPVEAVYLDSDGVLPTTEEVVRGLPDPVDETAPPRRALSIVPDPDEDAMKLIPASDYIPLLTGRNIDREGKVSCPFHDERTPSLHAYGDPGRGWKCFGCGVGGDIFTFGSLLFGIPSRGSSFPELKQRIALELLGTVA